MKSKYQKEKLFFKYPILSIIDLIAKKRSQIKIVKKNDEIPFQTNDNYFNDIYLNIFSPILRIISNNPKLQISSNIIDFIPIQTLKTIWKDLKQSQITKKKISIRKREARFRFKHFPILLIIDFVPTKH